MDVASLGFAIASEPAVKATSDLDRMSAASKRAEGAATSLGTAATRELSKVGNSGRSLDKVVSSMSGMDRAILDLRRDIASLSTAMDAQARATSTYIANQNAATAATEKLTTAILRQRTIPSTAPRAPSMPRPANNNNISGMNTSNIAAQFQDIGVTAAMGSSPLQIALQQGTQLSAVFEQMKASGQSAGAALATAFRSIISPMSLVTLAAVAASAAAIQYFMNAGEAAKSLDDSLEENRKNILALGDAYGLAGLKADDFTRRSIVAQESASRRSRIQLERALRVEAQSAVLQMTDFTQTPIDRAGMPDFTRRQFSPFHQQIMELQQAAQAGRLNASVMKQFEEGIEGVVQNQPGLRKVGDEILGIVEAASKASFELGITDSILKSISRSSVGGRGAMDRAQEAGRDAYERQQRMGNDPFARIRINPSEDAAEIARRRAETESRLLGIYAQSPAEKAAAARAAAAAQDVSGESAAARADRVDAAGKIALAQATHALTEAQEQRSRSLDQTLAQQQLEISLIGQTVGEAAKLRMEFEQISQVREEAARNGVAADEAEIASIRKKAEEYGKFAEQVALANLNRDLGFERDQLFRTTGDQANASRLRGAGLAIDLNSPEAQKMRDIQQITELRDGIKGFFSDFRAGLLQGDDIGKALGNAILNALNKQLDKMAEQAFTHLANAIAGSFGLGGGTATGGGGAAMGLAGAVAAAVGGANDNYAPGAVTRSPLGSISAYASAIKSIESGGNYGALGPWTKGDRAYGAYQVMGNNVGPWTKAALGSAMSPSQYLASNSAQDAVFEHRFGGYVDKYGASGAAQAWFGGPGSVGKGGAGADVLGTTGSAYVNKFNAALGKLGNTAEMATKNLGGFAGGLGSLAQSLMSVGGGSGGGGWFSNLMGMFGGAGGATNFMMGISPAATRHIAAGFGGLFARGGISDRPAIFGEAGPEAAVPLPDGRRIPVEMRMQPQSAGGMHITIGWDQGSNGNIEPVIRNVARAEAGPIAEQTSQNTIGRYNYQQKTGGAQGNDHFYKRLKRRA